MSGGKYLNNWRMAELHAKEAPDRVRELEQWGGVFDRTPVGPHVAARVRRPHAPAARAHRRPHRPRADPHAAGPRASAQDVDVFMECTITHLLKDGDRVSGAFGYWRATGALVALPRPGVRARDRRHRAASTRSRPTRGSAPATGTRSPTRRAPSSSTWSSSSSTRPGMVWPPGVRGLLVTEAVRGEGGLLTNAERRALHGALRPAAAWSSRRATSSRARSTPRSPRAAARRAAASSSTCRTCRRTTVRKKLPSMYAQFMELAGVDITKAPMEVGPTCHYIMGGDPRRRRDRRRAASSACSRRASARAACSGATRLGGNSLSDLLVFGRRAGEARGRVCARRGRAARSTTARSTPPRPSSSASSRRDDDPYALHAELQHDDAGERRHLPRRGRPDRGGRRASRQLKARVRAVARRRRRAACVQPGLAPLDGPAQHARLRRGDRARGAAAPRVARRAQPARLPGAVDRLGPPQPRRPQGAATRWRSTSSRSRRWTSLEPVLAERAREGRACEHARRSRSGAATPRAASSSRYEAEAGEGTVVLDAVHEIQRTSAPDLAVRWNCKAAKCGSCGAEVNGKPRLMCKTRLDDLPADRPVRVGPLRAFPIVRDLVTDVSWNYEVNKRIPPFRRSRTPTGACSRRTSTASRSSASASSASSARTSATSCATTT